MKNKKKGVSKKTWVVDCRTDSAFDFALRVLKEAENKKYSYELRCNFVKIAYSNSCEAIAKAQTDPVGYKLKSAFKLFTRNLKQITTVSSKIFKSDETNYKKRYEFDTIENPFDYVEIEYDLINKYFNTAKNTELSINDAIVSLFSTKFHYPMIYQRPTFHDYANIDTKLLPTNDIIVYIPETVCRIFEYAENAKALYHNNDKEAIQEKFINLINYKSNDGNDTCEIPDPQLIKFPKNTFDTLTSLIHTASINPENVEEIYLTGYRLGDNNPMIADIINATNNKIQCKLYIELNARGEIDRDMKYIKDLINNANHQYLDIKINYNGIKVHGKMIYIKLKDKPAIGVFGTGNYNPQTAMIYKDYHYISCEKNVTDLVLQNFNTIWNSDQPILSSISNILPKEIYEEILKGDKGKIWIQTNHLDNKHIVSLLKEAMHRGCDVRLIVRTTKGFHNKEMKNCKTVIGKYLEHSRVYIFGDGKDRRVYLSSSDILFRNLYNRFESYVKISDEKIQKELVNDFRDLYKNGQK